MIFFEHESLSYALNSDTDFILLFELRVRRSGKFWSTVTMETSDLQEEERALPALAMARCHQEDPASPGEEVGRVACSSAAPLLPDSCPCPRSRAKVEEVDLGYRWDFFKSTCSVLGLLSCRCLKTFPCSKTRAEPFFLPPHGDTLGDIRVTQGT